MKKRIVVCSVLAIFANNSYAATEVKKNTSAPASSTSKPSPAFSVFPIGINNDSRNMIPSALVRGAEDGKAAVNLEQWLIPFDAVTTALNIKVRQLGDGQMELRSPEIFVQLSEQELHKDKEIGMAVSVADIAKLFNVSVSFDISQYALILKLPILSVATNNEQQAAKKIISFEGLEILTPDHFNFSAISEQLRISGQQKKITYTGDLLAVGNLEKGSWYVDVNQVTVDKPDSWRLKDLQYYWKTNDVDYVIGSQPTFWQNKLGGDFWGVTLLMRDDFGSMLQSSGSFDPISRRAANTIKRTITGQAEPNTLVRLIERFSNRVIGEVFVNSSGLYSFDNVVSNTSSVNDYEILLYPKGILTVEPERVSAKFISRASQLQKGASAFMLSGGVNRKIATRSGISHAWGEATDFTGGASFRYGLFDSLTLGAGAVYQQGWQALGEFSYSPEWLPFTANATALKDFKTHKLDYNAQAQLQLFKNFNANFSGTPLSKQAFLNWSPWYWLAFRGGGAINSTTTTTVKPKTWFSGATVYGRLFDTFASVDANYDSNAILKINSLVYRDSWSINYQSDDIRKKLDLSYNFSDSNYSRGNYGHSLLIGMEINKQINKKDELKTARWHYHSADTINDGRSLIDAEIGYGIGTQGQGFIASLSTPMIPGIELSFNYQDISVASKERSFFLNISTNFRIEPNLSLSNRSYTLQNLRGEGGLFIQPFLDKNDNGKYDGDDSIYTENAERLLQLNGYPVSKSNIELDLQGLYIRQQPGKYRLDLDPSGYPIEGKPSLESYAIEINPGTYTTVLIPFSVTYTIAGSVIDIQGKPVAGAKVEAVTAEKSSKGFAISNGAGVFFIDNLHQGKYQLLLDGQTTQTELVEIKSDSKTMLEVTLKK